MALSSDQLQTLRKQLELQKTKLEDVLQSLKAGDPASDSSRTINNADAGTDAIESSELVEYASLERETQLLLSATKDALVKMDEGTYGVTADGEEIPFERLQVDPTASTIVK
jgi:RNA polymerase-binding transcription factor DksA